MEAKLMEILDQHHVKYLERDGEDEIIFVTHKEHMRIHNELKAQGVPPIPLEVIKAAHARSPLGRASNKKFRQSVKGKILEKRMRRSASGRTGQKRWRQSNLGKKAQIRASQSDASKEAHQRYNQSEKGKLANRIASAKYYANQKEMKS
jgi:hypothetical protein